MVGALKVRVEDENEADKFNKVKKFGETRNVEQTKRAALGDLQNRAVLRNVANGKEVAKKDLKETKLQALRNAKPRVDTHWKKSSLVSNAITAATQKVTTAQTSTAAQPKMLMRSSSIRLTGAAAAAAVTAATAKLGVNGAQLQRPSGSQLNAGSGKLKTLTTKVVESKLQQVKQITKVTRAKSIEGKLPITAATSLKREDSNLSRRSLTKLKAALQRDATGVSAKAVMKSKSMEPQSETGKIEQIETTATVSMSSTNVGGGVKEDAIELKIVSVQSYANEMLNAVEDIDAGDNENLVLVSEYVNDIYDYLYRLEAEQEIRPTHLDGQQEVSPKMRAVLIDWINEVHVQFHCIAETYQIAVAIIDRYLQVVKNTKRSHLQLVGVTALFIAAKYEELYPPALNDFVYITDNTYSAKQILQMELKIFKTLDCNLSRPLPIQFLRRFSKAANAEDVHHGMAKYFLELATIDYEMASYKPSEIAAASLFLSLNLLDADGNASAGLNNKLWTTTLEWYSRYTADHVRPIAKKLATIAHNAPQAKLKAVYTKYQSSKFHKISLRPELQGARMDGIIKSKE